MNYQERRQVKLKDKEQRRIQKMIRYNCKQLDVLDDRIELYARKYGNDFFLMEARADLEEMREHSS